MTGDSIGSSPEAKAADMHVFGELLKRGVLPFRAASGNFGVSTSQGRRLELQIVLSSGDDAEGGHHFTVADFQPRTELFFLCVELADEEITSVWVFPSISFFVYAELIEKQDLEERDLVKLSLDALRLDSFAESLREYVSFFRDRWDPIVQFDYFQRYMPPLDTPGFERAWEDLEDILMLMEISESRKQWPADDASTYLAEGEDSDSEGRQVRFTSQAREQLDSIPLDDRNEVKEAIRSLADNPQPSGSIGLQGSPGNYRVRKFP